MLLLDFSGTIVSNIMGAMFADPKLQLDEDLIRHNVLNSIRKVLVKFKGNGKLIIACDAKSYWRKDVFPYYKIKRQEKRKSDNYDWETIFKYISKIKKEIKEHLPYPVIEVNGAEADDIIAVLAKLEKEAPVIIISRDHDLKQLQKYSNVKQWNPIDDRFETCYDPQQFLLEHIITGDVGDSIPNIFSAENSFAIGQRQKPATKKRIADILEMGVIVDDELQRRFELNQTLIDLEKIPDSLVTEIVEEYNREINKGKKNLMNYFLMHNLRKHAEDIQDF